MAVDFLPGQRQSLHVLGYLLYRMGRYDEAAKVFAVLAAPLPTGGYDRQALSGMAAVSIARNDGAAALRYLHEAMKDSALSSKSAALHLMRAKALWMEGRKEEAKGAVDQYLYLVGDDSAP